MSSDPHEASIRVQVLGGTWEEIGADRYRGVAAEGLQMSSNAWGADTCSFTLRRDPAAVHPDLLAWTPVEVWIGGMLVWDGRVKETPSAEGADFSLNVQCEGWQYHLDDDVYSKTYVHTRLSDYGDLRSLPTADLSQLPQTGQVQQDAGSILLSFPIGSVTISHGVGVVCDLGPSNGCKRAVVATTSNSAANFTVYVIGSDAPYWGGTGAGREDYISAATLASMNGAITGGTTTSTHRYVTLLLWTTATGTIATDVWVRFTSVQLFGSTAYESGTASILTSDMIVKDALTQGTVLLSPDRTEVKAGTLFIVDPNTGLFTRGIPEFAMSDYQTPREVINAANAYENYETKMLPGRRFAFRPRASTPVYEIGEWSGADFADASTNSGDDIFNKVVVQGTGPDSANLTTIRNASLQAGVPLAVASTTPDNPGFETNTTSWTASAASTITRDTVVFDTGVASGRWDGINPATGTTLTETFTGTLHRVSVYRLDFRVKTSAPGAGAMVLATIGGITASIAASASWQTFSMTLVLSADVAPVTLVLQAVGITSAWFDGLALYVASPTLADRWGFNHSTVLPVGTALTTPVANRIGDLYLAAHKTTPFRGAFNATPGGVRRVLGGAPPHPAWLLADTGQLVRVGKVNPDTGAWSRSGTIAAVAYDHESLVASASLDENRAGFSALLERLSVVTGQRQT